MGSKMLTLQVSSLKEQGWSSNQIAEALDLLPEAVEIMLAGKNKSGEKDRWRKLKDIAISALEDVAENCLDFPSARVAASKVILDECSKGETITFDYDKLAKLIENSRGRIIECEAEVSIEKEGNTSECRELQLT